MKRFAPFAIVTMAILAVVGLAYAANTYQSTSYTPGSVFLEGTTMDEFERERLALDTAFYAIEQGTSLADGSIRGVKIADDNITLTNLSASQKQRNVSVSLATLTANTTNTYGVFVAPYAVTVTGIDLMFHAIPASASGTVLANLKWWDASGDAEANVNTTADFDCEGMVAKEGSDIPTAGVALAAGDTLYLQVVSNNGDMTAGSGGALTITYTTAE